MIEASVIRFSVNDVPAEVDDPGGRRLLDVLRYDLGLTGTKEGCGEGECGACSVLVDDELVDSCLVPIRHVDGHAVRTVEGLARDHQLDPLQAAFLETGGAQCGICTPGMLMAGRAFLESDARPTVEAIREAIAGNLCRCTGYTGIVEAIRLAAASPPAARLVPGGERAAPPWATRPAAVAGPPVVVPETLSDALRILADAPHRPIAGGTDVMVALAARGAWNGAGSEEPLLDIRGLDELRGITVESGELVLGALTTFTELRRSPLVGERLPALAQAAASVGAVQIQNRGTLGGNIVNASPAGDTLPILLATDASVVLGSARRGERAVAATDFWTGYRTTVRAVDELVLRVRIPLPPGREVRFRKVGTRRAQSISKVVMAVAWRDERGRWRDVRVGLGSVAERPIRASRTEAALEGASPTPESADRAAATVAADISPIDDIRSTAAYRRAVTARILHRIVRDAGHW